MSIRRNVFSPGDPTSDVLDASYLNTIEDRLSRLENLKGSGPVNVINTGSGMTVSLGFQNKKYHFVKLLAQLDENSTADARIGRWTSALGFHATTDYPDIEVEEINGTKSCINTWGIALEHPESKDKKYIFMPWPLGCGTHIEGYDEDQRQVLTHMPVADGCCLRWENVVSCD